MGAGAGRGLHPCTGQGKEETGSISSTLNSHSWLSHPGLGDGSGRIPGHLCCSGPVAWHLWVVGNVPINTLVQLAVRGCWKPGRNKMMLEGVAFTHQVLIRVIFFLLPRALSSMGMEYPALAAATFRL